MVVGFLRSGQGYKRVCAFLVIWLASGVKRGEGQVELSSA